MKKFLEFGRGFMAGFTGSKDNPFGIWTVLLMLVLVIIIFAFNVDIAQKANSLNTPSQQVNRQPTPQQAPFTKETQELVTSGALRYIPEYCLAAVSTDGIKDIKLWNRDLNNPYQGTLVKEGPIAIIQVMHDPKAYFIVMLSPDKKEILEGWIPSAAIYNDLTESQKYCTTKLPVATS